MVFFNGTLHRFLRDDKEHLSITRMEGSIFYEYEQSSYRKPYERK